MILINPGIYGGIWKNYKEYIQSDWWKEKREYFLKLNPNCKLCGRRATQVHHESYESIGNEPSEDLMAVCHNCHQKIHGRQF